MEKNNRQWDSQWSNIITSLLNDRLKVKFWNLVWEFSPSFYVFGDPEWSPTSDTDWIHTAPVLGGRIIVHTHFPPVKVRFGQLTRRKTMIRNGGNTWTLWMVSKRGHKLNPLQMLDHLWSPDCVMDLHVCLWPVWCYVCFLLLYCFLGL